MIWVDLNSDLVFVKGPRKVSDIRKAILEATGKKTLRWNDWTIVGIASEEHRGIDTGLPYDPPRGDGVWSEDRKRKIGFNRDKS